jgi:phosphatidylglycerol:prolipoprotein diacylglycerol transferase
MAPPAALYHSLNPYGAFLSLGLVAGIAAILFLAKKKGLPVEPFVDLLFLLILAAGAGGRAWYVIEYHQELAGPGEWLQFWKGGLSFFGSLTLALPVYFVVLRWKRLPLWPTSDLLVPALPLTIAILRLGCFTAGCCYGKPTELPWGLNPVGSLSPSGEGPLHPTQLYEFVFLLALGAILYLSTQRKWFRPGVSSLGFFFCYGLYRLATNSMRGDLQPWIAGITIANIGAAATAVSAAALIAWRYRR